MTHNIESNPTWTLLLSLSYWHDVCFCRRSTSGHSLPSTLLQIFLSSISEIDETLYLQAIHTLLPEWTRNFTFHNDFHPFFSEQHNLKQQFPPYYFPSHYDVSTWFHRGTLGSSQERIRKEKNSKASARCWVDKRPDGSSFCTKFSHIGLEIEHFLLQSFLPFLSTTI